MFDNEANREAGDVLPFPLLPFCYLFSAAELLLHSAGEVSYTAKKKQLSALSLDGLPNAMIFGVQISRGVMSHHNPPALL